MNKMKYIIAVLTVSLAFSACSDWLDVHSSTQIKGEDLFESEAGFQDALTGIYLNMASENLYGKNLTWYFTEIMAQPIYNRNSSTYPSCSFLKKDGYANSVSETYVKNIWETAYTTIASINNMLKMLDEKGSVINSRTRDLYEGELLALRAYIHLDLMRLYGYGQYNEREEFDERLTIPYVTVYSKELTPQRTYAATMKMVIADLTDAVAHLANDPLVTPFTAAEQTSCNALGYWENRKYHMNYYAAKAMLARAYMWDGSEDSMAEAVKIANELIGLESKAYTWNTIDNIAVAYIDRTFSTEHLFTLNVYTLSNIVNDYMTDLMYNPSGKTVITQWSYIAYDIFNAYGYDYNTSQYVPGYVGYDDIRFHLHFKATTYDSKEFMYTYKLYQENSSLLNDRIPMIKISEMYYILAENYLAKGEDENALGVINQIRKRRGLQTPLTLATIENEFWSTVKTELLKEYMREFTGEGQLIYYLKRKGVTSYNNEGIWFGTDRTFDDQSYVLPLPTDEVVSGNRVQ